jgi:transposase
MRRLGYTYEKIADFLKISQRAVQYTVEKKKATPQHKNAGRPPRLSKEEVDSLVEFVTSTKRTRRLTYLQIAEERWPEGEVGADSVKYALHSRGYRRRVALRKPPLSEENKKNRLEWAREHLHWSEEQWSTILWSDETWVKAGRHRKTLVTRKPGEELDDTCIVEKIQRQSGWLFWACFHSNTKGPHLFWEKDWGSINGESYRARIVPIIHGWVRLNPQLYFMQDNAPGHAARLTREDLAEREVRVIYWPAYSPDLNPIEEVWNKMKDWLMWHYPSRIATYDQLRQQVTEAWNTIGEEVLIGLIGTMRQRCQDVINAEGGHTVW